jgi:hypothetical protein
MKKFLVAVLLVFATSANATVWTINSTVQDGTAADDSATMGMLSWVSNGTNGPSYQRVYGGGWTPLARQGPSYACYGLSYPYPVGHTTCVAAGTPSLWDNSVVEYTGGSIDDSMLTSTGNTFTWTGQAGTAYKTGPEFWVSSIYSGTYFGDGTATGTDPGAGAFFDGYDADGFTCFAEPLAVYSFGSVDFCGNGTGGAGPGGTPQTIANRFISNGITSVVDNADGTITVTMTDSTYTDCLADTNCTPGSSSSDLTAIWRFNVVPVPAAAWLFGSALGLLGWLRRKTI